MKKYFILMASAALMLAVSCNKEEVNTPATSNETELITVQINPQTKTSLSGYETIWSDGDAISVTVGKDYIGTLDYKGDNTFSGEVVAGHNGEAILNYPAGVTEVPAKQAAVKDSFAEGAALLEGTTTMDALRAGEDVILNNTTALLKFSVAQAGDVTFEVGAAEYTVTGCETGNTYYACVVPAADVAFKASINGNLSKEATGNVTFPESQITDLGTLPEPVEPENAVIRINNMNGWETLNITIKSGNTTLANAVEMTNEGNNIFAYTLDSEYVGKEITYFITYSWYQTITKTIILAADSESTPINLNTTYLQPGTWDQADAWFAAYMWADNVDAIWVKATYILTNSENKRLFEVEIPDNSTYSKIIWVRMNSSKSELSWDSKWNQTGNLTLKHNCYCIQDGDAWNEPTGDYWY